MQKKSLYFLALILVSIVVMIGVRFFVARQKQGFHIDEIYSYQFIGGGEAIMLHRDKEMFNKLIPQSVILDYVTINDNERYDFGRITEKTGKDVHPPLYYWILHVFTVFFDDGRMVFWGGFWLNAILFVFSAITFLLLGKILVKDKFLLYFFFLSWGFSAAAISDAIFIRMYEMLTLFVLLTSLATVHFWRSKKVSIKKSFFLFFSFLGGLLTHYFFLFLLLPLSFFSFLEFFLKRQYKKLLTFSILLFTSVSLSLFIFPQAIRHLFFSYRSNDMRNSALNLLSLKDEASLIVDRILKFVNVFDQQVFPCAFLFLLLSFFFFAILLLLVGKGKKLGHKTLSGNEGFIFFTIFIAWTCIVFFLVPVVDTRYIVPALPLAFIGLAQWFDQSNFSCLAKKVLVVTILLFILGNSFIGYDFLYTKFNNGEIDYISDNDKVMVISSFERRFTVNMLLPILLKCEKVYLAIEGELGDTSLLDFDYIFAEKNVDMENGTIFGGEVEFEKTHSIDYYDIYAKVNQTNGHLE